MRNKIHIILFVENQQKSTDFYESLFREKPILNVTGMTEFLLLQNVILGLMPNNGIAKILQDKSLHPQLATGIPRCELYMYIEDLEKMYEHAKSIDAKIINPISERNWGDKAFYIADPDGHLIAFAKQIKS